MATTNFYLKPENQNGTCSVMLVYQDKGQKFKYSTKLKIRKGDWKNGRLVKGKASELKEVNCILDGYRDNINAILREGLFNQKEYSVSVVERKFKMSIGELSTGNNFVKLFQSYIDSSKQTKKPSTIRAYGSTLTRLKDYEIFKPNVLAFEKMNQSFYEGFTNYLIREHKSLNNTVGKHIKTLKSFLNYCIQNELANANVNLNVFKVTKEEVDIVCLTDEELFKMLALNDLPGNLESIRDNFCFGCFTGLRFSDIAKIKNSNIKDNFIEIRSEKTRNSLKIPINMHAATLLNKHKNKYLDRPLPPVISNQKTNYHIKEIAELAGIDEWVEIEKFSGSNKVKIRKAKYDLITTHTARRTFVTLSLEKGIRAEIVMEITGHKKYQTFKRYIKLTDTVKLIEMNNVWNKPVLKVI